MDQQHLPANFVSTMNMKDLVSSRVTSTNEHQEQDVFHVQKKAASKPLAPTRRRGKNSKRPDHPLATVIRIIKKPREYMDHSYIDFSKVPQESGDSFPDKIEEMTFPQKVHHILSRDIYNRWISWLPHGRSFKVHVPAMFEKEVLMKYFGHKRYSTFLRNLSNHGFKHITKGTERNSYYHSCMLRGMPHLCNYMPQPHDARRLIPDPENEPDFYEISKRFPLILGTEQAAVISRASQALNLASPLSNGNFPQKSICGTSLLTQQENTKTDPLSSLSHLCEASGLSFPYISQAPAPSQPKFQVPLSDLNAPASSQSQFQAPLFDTPKASDLPQLQFQSPSFDTQLAMALFFRQQF